MVDGTATPVASIGDYTSRLRPQVILPPVFYTADGRLAYVYPKSDGTNTRVVMLGGQEVARGVNLSFPVVSPDGKHFALISWAGKGHQVIVDDKPGRPTRRSSRPTPTWCASPVPTPPTSSP